MYFRIRILYFLLFSTFVSVGQNNVTTKKTKTEKTFNYYLQKADSCKVKLDYTNSYKYITEVLSLAKEKNDINAEILCTIKLIELYRHAALFPKSELYLKQASFLIKANSTKVSDFNLMYYYNRKAALFSEYYHVPDSSLVYTKKALALSEKLQNKDFQFTSLQELGFFYEQKNDLKKAVSNYQKAFELAKANNKKSETCDALVNLARTYEKSNDFKIALEKCNEGLVILEADDNFFQKLLFYDIKQKTYEKLGDKSSAFDNLKLRLKYTDLYYEKNAQNNLLEENRKHDQLKRVISESNRKKDIEEVKKNQLLLMSIILLFVLGLISLIYYSKKMKIANKQLDFYSKENAFLLNEANHRINNNLQLIIVLLNEELDKIEESNSDDSAIKKILTKVEAISTLHRHLYQSTDKKSIYINEYLDEIVNNFSDIFTEKEIVINYEFEKISVSIDLAMYLGLLTTELFINSIKHAFYNQTNKMISLKIYKKETILYLDYYDNGKKTIGKEIKPNLVETICQQIKANSKIETKSGFEIYVTKELA